MASLQVGQEIRIPCVVGKGAFAGESLVTVDTMTGPVSGFVSTGSVEETPDGQAYLIGLVKELKDNTVVVLLSGSFFTTTGIAYFQRDALAA